jgi:hypothetical protein
MNPQGARLPRIHVREGDAPFVRANSCELIGKLEGPSRFSGRAVEERLQKEATRCQRNA